MNNKNTGRVFGLFLLASFISGVFGTFSRGLSEIDFEQSGELITNQLLSLKDQMILAIRLDILASAITLAAALFLYQRLVRINSNLSVSYVAIISVNFVIAIMSNLVHFALLDLASSGTSNFGQLSLTFYNSYYWMHFLIIFFYGVSGFLLYYLLAKGQLIFKWIGYWGMAASVIVMFGSMAQFLDFSVPFALFMQNGIFVLTFMIYLLTVGFRPEQSQ